MFSTFTTAYGMLMLRTVDLRRIEDTIEGTCVVAWDDGGDVSQVRIQGTATENLARIKADELTELAAAEERQVQAQIRLMEAQQRIQRGYPALPVPRGKLAPHG